MRIGIDLRPLQGETRFRGIGKTQEFFMQALAKMQTKREHTFVFFVDNDLETPSIVGAFPGAVIKSVHSPRLGRRRYFRSFLPAFLTAKPSPNEVDVFLQFDVSLGVPKSVPTVAVFYDLIPLLFRDIEQESTKHVPFRRRLKDRLAQFMYWHKYLRFLKAFRKPTHLLAISESSKKDLLNYMPDLPGSSVSVVPLGVDESFFSEEHTPSVKIRELAARPYLLYVGGIDTRKNIVELIKTFYALKPDYPDLQLVLVGKEFALKDQLADRGWFKELDKNKSLAKDILTSGFVSHDDLLFLYHHAQCFVFPSLYEGFGLPILEAMAAGCPVVAYNTSSIPEVAGKACALVKPGIGMQDAVGTMLANSKRREKLAHAGKIHAGRFTWAKTAEAILMEVVKYGKES